MFGHLTKNQKFALQVLFWLFYYVLFGLIWAKDGNYRNSFYLEFILLPVRILAVYVTILYLIPNFLLKKKFLKFLGLYVLTLLFLGLLQQVAIYFFYETDATSHMASEFSFNTLIRAVILINSTIFFVSTIYILNSYFNERELRIKISEEKVDELFKIELKSNRRNYLISSEDIIYIEGLGNYINYHLDNGKKITVYQSLKKCLGTLPNNFVRVHKSYIINKNKIVSYGNESVEMLSDQIIPLGNSFDLESLGL